MGSTGKETRKLLSLDGGGVRGMSTIAILRELMERLAMKRNVPVVHPWEEFDMIGGTSTGGLLAIMLGRLHMTIDECEDVYVELAQKIFVPNRSKANIVGQALDFVNARGKFSSEALEAGIKDAVKSKGFSDDQLFYNQEDGGCKVFVSVVKGEDGENTVIRSYVNPEMPNPMRRYCRIWEAARATSAASTFFDSIEIGPHHQTFVDGALGYNNPIRLLDRESNDLWPDSERIFVSIGTGTAPGASLEGDIFTLAQRIQDIVVETQKTHEGFYKDHEKTLVANRQYFRFNVEGLKRIGLEEHKARSAIYTATDTYLASGVPGTMIKQLVEVLKTVHNTYQTTPASLQVPLGALTIANSPTPKLTYAEKLQAKKEREEATQKLFRAVSLNKIANVKELLEKGADPNVPGKSEFNGSEMFPVYVAATNKFNEVLRLLIEHKANVDAVSPDGGTALNGAITRMNQEAVEELLKGGADPNKVDQTRFSPLQNAAQFADSDSGIFDAVLLAEPEIDLKTSCGTALDFAMTQGQYKTARRLLNLGADPDLVRDSYQQMFKYVPA